MTNTTKQDFAKQVAIITGGGTGLGKAIAIELASRGASVIVASRKMENLNAALSEMAQSNLYADSFQVDVRDAEQVKSLVEFAKNKFGKIDILVNNAAGNFIVPAEKLSPNGWNAVVDIVLNGTWYCSSYCGQEMIKQKHGNILNIIATYAWTGAPGVVHSASAKAGVLAMTRTLAAEWGKYGIRVNALAPGIMITPGAAKNLLFESKEAQDSIVEKIPLKRFAEVNEVARLAAFLCSNETSYITGDVMTADGGRWLNDGMLDLL